MQSYYAYTYIDKENYGFPKEYASTSNLTIVFVQKPTKSIGTMLFAKLYIRSLCVRMSHYYCINVVSQCYEHTDLENRK